MFTSTKLLFIKLYRLLTLLELSFVWWLFIAFFWLLGFVSPNSFNIATVLLLFYYYLGLLPTIGQFLSSSYGQLFHSKQDLKLLPYLLVLSISLFTLPGIAHFYKLSYITAFGTALAIHLVLHVLWLRAASVINNLLKLFFMWLVILNPLWMTQLQQYLAKPLLTDMMIVGLLIAASLAAMLLGNTISRRPQPNAGQELQQTRLSLRSKPKHQLSLAASYLFQFNAKPAARLLVFCGVCALVPLLQTLSYFWFYAEWHWFPKLGWKLLDDSLFTIPLVYWLHSLDNTLSQVKSAWLYIPQSRNALFSFLERQILTQLMLLSLPLLLLLYCWQPSNPHFLLSALMLLSLALLSTYWPLCYPQSLGTVVMCLMLTIMLGPETLLLASPTTQLYLIGSMLLITIVLRYFAEKLWLKRDFTKAATFFRRRHV